MATRWTRRPSGRSGVELARATDYAIYFLDLKMPGGMDGIETMMEIRKLHSDAPVIIITAYATVDTAIAAMKEGAQEYIVKPCNPEEISLLVARIIKVKNLQLENAILRKKLSGQYQFRDIITKNPKMQAILELVRDVASLRSTVLIRGESGTGKELVARAVHFSGDRAGRPFVSVSCAALAETLLESELFGYEKGAFTGAATRTMGKFELADGGTIFLDEIGDIPAKLQADLLRVLQERRFYRLGGKEEVKVDVRVIAATNRDLAEEVREGRFRDDLYYRLNVIEIRIPPLRERREDIPMLTRHLVETAVAGAEQGDQRRQRGRAAAAARTRLAGQRARARKCDRARHCHLSRPATGRGGLRFPLARPGRAQELAHSSRNDAAGAGKAGYRRGSGAQRRQRERGPRRGWALTAPRSTRS